MIRKETDMTIDQLVKNWLADLDCSPHTVNQYRKTIDYWFRFLHVNKKDINRPVRANVLQYKISLLGKKSPFTINAYLASVKSFYSYLENNNLYDNIAAGIREKCKYKNFRRDSLNENEVIRLLSFDKTTAEGLRDYLILAFMLVLGLRRSEVAGVCDSDIRPKHDKFILWVKRKGHIEKEPIMNIPPALLENIRKYQEVRGQNNCDQLFQDHKHKTDISLKKESFSKIVNKRLAQAGLKSKSVTAHSLRHTAAVTAIKNGATIYEVQKMLGHSTPEVTRPYFMSIENEKYMDNPAVLRADKLFLNTASNGK